MRTGILRDLDMRACVPRNSAVRSAANDAQSAVRSRNMGMHNNMRAASSLR